MRQNAILVSTALALGLAGLAQNASAANLTTTNIQASGANWTASIWKTNSAGMATNNIAFIGTPVVANTYELVPNGFSTIGNGLTSTRIRNNAVAGIQTFNGASLTMYTNTELRAKGVGAILNFPGTGGTSPALILNGGLLNGGDDSTFIITGRVQIASQSYISHGANGGGGGISANRAFNFVSPLSGSGNMVIINSGTTVPQLVSGPSNTYSGTWIVQCGWLQGTTNGSLGTNSSFIVDPSLSSAYLDAMPNATSPVGPAWFEPMYDLNSAGTLTINNGGIMRLHQNCAFTAATINGTPLTPGLHYYNDLVTQFGATFAAGGSGAITVQPYGPLPSLGPIVTTQPLPQALYAGKTAHLRVVASANGSPPLTYRWRKNTVNLSDGGNISGATNASLVITGVGAGDVGSYDLLVSNTVGFVTSTIAPLTIVSPSGSAYEAAVLAANPSVYYRLNEMGDPATNNTLAFDNGSGYDGVYSTTSQNGNGTYNIAGPRPTDGFPGFESANTAVNLISLSTPASRVTLPPWNLNTNTVTIVAWINPNGAILANAGVVLSRGGTTVSGIVYNNVGSLGYIWDNEYETYSWNPGITPPQGQWSMVALAVSPTNATLTLLNTNGILSASNPYSHVVQNFEGTSFIGDDSAGNNRTFNGAIDDVAVFARTLSAGELFALYTNASAVSTYAPLIATEPNSLSLFAGQTATFSVTAGGTEPLTYVWQSGPAGGPYTTVNDGGRISGATTPNLTISNVNAADPVEYLVSIANAFGTTNSTVADLAVSPTSPAENITMAVQEAAGADWDIGANSPGGNTNWSDFNPASYSAAAKPGSTYELLPGTRLRSPANPTHAIFPGNVLTMDGNAIWSNNPAAGNATISEFRFKQPPNQLPPNQGLVFGSVYFKLLRMNGGQLDVGNEGVVVVQGQIDILTNTPIYSDAASDRGYRIESLLTGGPSTSIEYHGYNQTTFQNSYINDLNIAGNNNTFSGKWNVVVGTLLGSGNNSLGTNDIIIGTQGALETAYDVNNTNGTLFVSGKMFLHQNNTFHSVFVNGSPLAPGTYTAAQLTASYPTNFPSTWVMKVGSTISNASGSITVLVTPAPTITQQPLGLSKYPTETAQFIVQAQGTLPLAYQWKKNGASLQDTTDGRISGSLSNVLTVTNLVNLDGGNYTVVITNINGGVTSAPALLTILPTGPALNLTLDFGGTPIQQAQGLDWNTTNNWSDGNAAATSALSNPGSTYEVVTGARLRSPVTVTNSVFPGVQLTIDGSGIFVNNNDATIGELRLKHGTPATIYFKKLRMNGGQLDTGDNGLVILQGEMDILANTPIYVDNAAGQDRSYQIDSWLTGNGSIEYHAFDSSFTGGLNVTCNTNTYAGTWHVFQGPLLGSGNNCLGTNSITVESGGAVETLYNLNNPSASLVLNGTGQLLLHQNDTFHNVNVAGTDLAPGTYTFAQLNTAYPANFPASWSLVPGSVVNTGSGTLTVLTGPSNRPTMQFSNSGGSLTLAWPSGFWLIQAPDVTGPWTTNTTATSPFTVTPSGPRQFYGLQPQ